MDLTSLSNFVPTASSLAEGSRGQPLEIPLDKIVTGENPRTKFDPQYLDRLAASIKARGVKSPISVKSISPEEAKAWFAERGLLPPPTLEGFFKINHGECRYKASSMAGKSSIPAIIDEQHVRVDALIENIQRQDLDPLDIANAITRELADNQGLKKGDIARVLGVSNAYVSIHLKLLTLPNPIASMVREGRSKDVTSLVQLASAYQDFPKEVSDFCASADEPTQAMVRHFIAALKERNSSSPRGRPPVADDTAVPGSVNTPTPTDDDDPKARPAPANLNIEQDAGRETGNSAEVAEECVSPPSNVQGSSANARITGVEIRHDGRTAILFPKAPSARGLSWIRYEGEVLERQIELSTIEAVVALILG